MFDLIHAMFGRLVQLTIWLSYNTLFDIFSTEWKLPVYSKLCCWLSLRRCKNKIVHCIESISYMVRKKSVVSLTYTQLKQNGGSLENPKSQEASPSHGVLRDPNQETLTITNVQVVNKQSESPHHMFQHENIINEGIMCNSSSSGGLDNMKSVDDIVTTNFEDTEVVCCCGYCNGCQQMCLTSWCFRYMKDEQEILKYRGYTAFCRQFWIFLYHSFDRDGTFFRKSEFQKKLVQDGREWISISFPLYFSYRFNSYIFAYGLYFAMLAIAVQYAHVTDFEWLHPRYLTGWILGLIIWAEYVHKWARILQFAALSNIAILLVGVVLSQLLVIPYNANFFVILIVELLYLWWSVRGWVHGVQIFSKLLEVTLTLVAAIVYDRTFNACIIYAFGMFIQNRLAEEIGKYHYVTIGEHGENRKLAFNRNHILGGWDRKSTTDFFKSSETNIHTKNHIISINFPLRIISFVSLLFAGMFSGTTYMILNDLSYPNEVYVGTNLNSHIPNSRFFQCFAGYPEYLIQCPLSSNGNYNCVPVRLMLSDILSLREPVYPCQEDLGCKMSQCQSLIIIIDNTTLGNHGLLPLSNDSHNITVNFDCGSLTKKFWPPIRRETSGNFTTGNNLIPAACVEDRSLGQSRPFNLFFLAALCALLIRTRNSRPKEKRST